MDENIIKIFKLYGKLQELLGKEAVANLTILYDRHPEMFADIEDVTNTINKVIAKPEIIVEAKRDEKYNVFKALKQLNNEKMGEVGIKKESELAEIFHANKKKIREFKRLEKKLATQNLVSGEDAQPSHPDKNRVWATDISSMCSLTSSNIISQSNRIKELNNLKNKLQEGAEVIYQSPNFGPPYDKLLQDERSIANEIDTETILQNKENSNKNTDNQESSSNLLDLLDQAEANQEIFKQSPRVDEILKNQDLTNDLKIDLGLDKELDDSNQPSNPNNSKNSNNKRK